MPPDHIPGKPVTDGEWQVKTTMEIHHISESVQDLKNDFKELTKVVRQQVHHAAKISELSKDIKDCKECSGTIRKEVDEYKGEFNKLSGRFSVITTIFGLIIASMISYFFWGTRQQATAKQSASIVKKMTIKGTK